MQNLFSHPIFLAIVSMMLIVALYVIDRFILIPMIQRTNLKNGGILRIIFGSIWCGILGIIIISFLQLLIPADNSEKFNISNDTLAYYRQFAVPSPGLPPGKHVMNPIIGNIRVFPEYKKYVRKNESFNVDVYISATNHRFGAGKLSARLRTPKALEILSGCGGAGGGEKSNESTCESYWDSPYNDATFSWIITPLETGKYKFFVDQILMNLNIPDDASNYLFNRKLGDSSGVLHSAGSKFDGTIEGDVEVLTTIGFGQSTYDWLKIIGAIIGTALGGGWFWIMIKRQNTP